MYILNERKEILDEIKNKVNDFDELFIAVSFITNEGFKILFDIDKMNSKVNIITTTDEYITSPFLLKELKKRGCKIKVISQTDERGNVNKERRSFHSKFIISRKGEEYHSMLGSLNITKFAIENKYESVIVNYESKSLLAHFESLWNKGINLSDEYLEKYIERYNRFQSEYKPFMEELNKKVGIQPNEMQEKVLEELSELRDNGERKALLYAATGTGKTYLSAFDLKRQNFNKALFIVHSRLIIKSAIRDYSVVFHDKNLLELKTGNKKLVNDSDIIFTTQNTIKIILEKQPDFLDKFDHFIFDESHKIGPNNEQGRILNNVFNLENKFILAMSATPWRSDDPRFVMESFNNNVVGNIDLAQAIKNRFVCDFNYEGIEIDVDFSPENLREDDIKFMVEKFITSVNSKKVWDNTKVKGILFTKNINEADLVTQMINEIYGNTYKAVSVHSKMNGELGESQSEEIQEYIRRLQNEDNPLNFIVTVDMFNEGVDIPRINTIGMFRFTNSSIIYSQQIGRGLRREGSDKKYLNIIDLVGNHDNSFERLIGLIGKAVIGPREIIEFINNIDTSYKNINLGKISKEKILKNIALKFKYKKYFEETISLLRNYKGFTPSLFELEKYLKESIQVIVNNFRKDKHFNPGNLSWVQEMYSKVDVSYREINEEESALIEAFSWIPITSTTPTEKELVLKLLDGNTINMEEKWHQYFYGLDVKEGWRYIRINLEKYFEADKIGNIKFRIDLVKNEKTLKILNDIKEYLEINIDRNDSMKKTWYSKFEILFMSGKAYRSMEAAAKVKNDHNRIYLMNSIDKEYSNSVLSKNEYIISTRGKKHYDPDNFYYNFVGKKVFHQNEMYFYVGEQSKPIEFNGYNQKNDGSEYATFKFTSKEQISENEFMYLTL